MNCPHCGAAPKKGTWLIGYELLCGTFFYNKGCIDQDDKCRIRELGQRNVKLEAALEFAMPPETPRRISMHKWIGRRQKIIDRIKDALGKEPSDDNG